MEAAAVMVGWGVGQDGECMTLGQVSLLAKGTSLRESHLAAGSHQHHQQLGEWTPQS